MDLATNVDVTPAQNSAQVRRTGLFVVSHYCPERPYLELRVPDEIQQIEQIVFKTLSRDQGFSGEPEEFKDTYHRSYSWFEVAVVNPAGRDRVPRRHLQHNAHAIAEFREHEITWHFDPENVSLGRWLSTIQSGDIIQVIPKARHRAWLNITVGAQITVRGHVVISELALLHSPSFGGDLYQPLKEANHIRLISILPGNDGEPIMCHLKQHHLGYDLQRSYECLSYCWGSRQGPRYINITALEGSGEKPVPTQVKVTSNLYDALTRLRYPSKSRTMWIDAICINQRDLAECSQQVSIMRQIYSQAENVIIWLGTENVVFDNIFAEADMVSRRYQQCLNENERPPDTTKAHTPLLDGGSYHVDNALFQHEYFRRAWVLQEVFNAKQALVQYGQKTFPWALILRLNECIVRSTLYSNPVAKNTMPPLFAELFSSNTSAPDRVPAYTESYMTKNRPLQILDVFLEGLDLETTDPRDKLFALFSFGEETSDFNEHDALIRPNYTKTTGRVFADFTRWWIRTHQSLRILSAIHVSQGRTWMRPSGHVLHPVSHGRATWSLWHDGRTTWAQGSLGLPSDCAYDAAKDQTLCLYEATDPMTLSLKGRQISVIKSLNQYPYYDIYQHLMSHEHPAECKHYARHGAYEILFDPLAWRGTWTSRAQRTDMQLLRQPYDRDLTYDKNFDHFVAHSSVRSASDERTKNWIGCHDQCLFYTDDGLLGLCPPMAQVGDVIVVLYGGPVPYILRPFTASDESESSDTRERSRYQLVGECYLEGFMQGYAVAGNCALYPEKVFELG